jgi:uncharacterized protein (DUF1330 family)
MPALLSARTSDFSYQPEERTMNRTVIVGFGMLVVGTALGAAAVQTLHAQAKPPAFQIVEVAVNDQDGFSKEFVPLISKVQQDVGGKFLARGGKTVSFQGAPPAPRIVLIQYDNMEKLQAALDSAAMKAAIAVGNKYSTQRIYGVEGLAP